MKKETKPGVHVMPKPPSPSAPEGSAAEVDAAWMQRIVPVLEGKAKAPNEFVSYLAEQTNVANDERAALLANLRQLGNRVNQMRERVTTLDGQIKARLADIRAWWDRPQAPADDGKPFLLKPEIEAKDAGPS